MAATTSAARIPARTLCHRSGCFGEVCVRAEDSVFTDCTWKPEYASSPFGECEPQSNGACGFTAPTEGTR
jgi:hypothetical protein